MLSSIKIGLTFFWRTVLFACGVLAVFFAFAALYFVFPQLVGKQLAAGDGRGEMFLNLAKIVGLFTVIGFSLFSAARYLARQLENTRSSPTPSGRGLVWLFKWLTPPEPGESRGLVRAFALVGLGAFIALFGVHLFFAAPESKASLGYGQVNTRPLLPDDPVLLFSFKNSHDGVQDIVEMRGVNLLIPSPDYESLKRITFYTYAEENSKRPIKVVEVIGYADAAGTSTLNQRLSRNRAASIRELLVAAGIPEAMISTRAAGVRKRSCTPANTYPGSLCLENSDRRAEVYFWHAENPLNK